MLGARLPAAGQHRAARGLAPSTCTPRTRGAASRDRRAVHRAHPRPRRGGGPRVPRRSRWPSRPVPRTTSWWWRTTAPTRPLRWPAAPRGRGLRDRRQHREEGRRAQPGSWPSSSPRPASGRGDGHGRRLDLRPGVPRGGARAARSRPVPHGGRWAVLRRGRRPAGRPVPAQRVRPVPAHRRAQARPGLRPDRDRVGDPGHALVRWPRHAVLFCPGRPDRSTTRWR